MQAPQVPDYLKPYAEGAAQQAQGLFNSGQLSPSYYSGATVAPFSGQTQTAINAITTRAKAGNPLLPAAQNQALSTIQGNYLYAGSNPYLQSAMDAANRGTVQQFGESVLPGLNASFAKAGRSSSGAYGNTVGRVSEGLARTLADSNARMASSNYTSERANQLAQVAGAPELAGADYNDANQMLQAGQLVDAQNQDLINADIDKYNYNANLRQNGLQNYINLLNSTAGSSGGVATSGAQYGGQTKTQQTLGMILGALSGFKK